MGLAQKIAKVDLFKRNDAGWQTGTFVGRPFRLSYSQGEILITDAWKEKANGVPHGCFLLAYYDNDMAKPETREGILLRVIEPTKLPTDQDVIASMVEYYKDGVQTGDKNPKTQLDTFTRYEFSFSGLSCSVLGSFYLDGDDLRFGADLENFYSAHNYSVLKPSAEILSMIVNYREKGLPGGPGDIRVGKVRYSSSQRFQMTEPAVPVYVRASDFAGKRTALFGMTRTGKSNTVKKIIQACVEISGSAPLILGKSKESPADVLKPFTEGGYPKYPVGQIIFDINGEYANPNLQDQGTAIFDLFKDKTVRYSTVEQAGTDFRVMKVNFFKETESGFELIRTHPVVADDDARFVSAFRTVDLNKPVDYSGNKSAAIRYDRRVAAYLCCLHRAGFEAPVSFKVKFTASNDVRTAVNAGVDPSKGISLEEAATWWEQFWEVYGSAPVFVTYKQQNQREWADEDLKALLVMLTRKRTPGGSADCSGFRILREISDQHTAADQKPFDQDIVENLRAGRIVIVDLSLGEETIQRMFTERITRRLFKDAMRRFTNMEANNFIQFYFEEAHNLFPKKDDKDLSQIYNRVAKEGAKLNLGLIYATQEVSSISSNILKATQNWFVSHLNNDDEIRELRKYYDFSDFTEALVRFSQDTDKGFVRMKTYSSPFVIPVQVDRFPSEEIG